VELPRFLSSKLARVLITGLVFTVLAVSIDLRATLEVLLGAKIGWLLLATLTIIFIRIIMAVRWWLILSTYGFSVSMWEITKLIFVTSSLGSVLPVGVGQDLLRGYHVVKNEGRLAEVSATILIDRVMGMVSMALVTVVASVLGAKSLERTPVLLVAVVAAVGILVGFGVVSLVSGKIRNWCGSESTGSPSKIATSAKALARSVLGRRVSPKLLSTLLLLSSLVQLARCAAFILVFRGLGAFASTFYYFVTIPVVFMLLQLPISLGGLGVREGALVVFFGDVGFTPEVSVAGGLVFHGLQLIAFLPGLLLFLFSRDNRTPRVPR